MPRQIIILTSSPRRNGNTNLLAKWVALGATEAGADVETIDIAHLDYAANGCTACMDCQKSDKFECVIEDEASEIIKRLPKADVLVFATPTYFFGPSAQLKLLLDRMFSLIKLDPEDGSRQNAMQDTALALVASSGGEMEHGIGLIEQTFRTLAEFLGQTYSSFLAPSSPQNPQGLVANDALRAKAHAFGAELAAA